MSDFDDVFDAIDDAVDKLHREIMFSAYSAVAQATPKDTGTAQNNWFPSITSPSKLISDSPGAFKSREQVVGGITPYSRSYITNNLPYIRRLNQG